MTLAGRLAVAAVGVFAGAVNTVAGAGSLLTFPVLVAAGLSPLSANVTNDIGVIPGNTTGAFGLREELRGQRARMWDLLPPAALGSLAGGVLLLALPAKAFEVVAPVLLLVASGITAAQPALARRVRLSDRDGHGGLLASTTAISVYGGYFGTGIGVLFFAALGVFVDDTAPRLNATKQILALVSNGVAGVLFAVWGPVNWTVVAVLGASSAVGGPLGARVSRRISAGALRAVIAGVGALAAVYLGVRQL